MNPSIRFTVEYVGNRYWVRDNLPGALNPLTSPRPTLEQAEARRREVVADWTAEESGAVKKPRLTKKGKL